MGAMEMPERRGEGLTKTCAPGASRAVDDLCFTRPMGRTRSLLGGNVAGKSTTIAMLLGLLEPSAGRVIALPLCFREHLQQAPAEKRFR